MVGWGIGGLPLDSHECTQLDGLQSEDGEGVEGVKASAGWMALFWCNPYRWNQRIPKFPAIKPQHLQVVSCGKMCVKFDSNHMFV